MIESQLLSKVIDENSFYTLNKFNVKTEDFHAIPHVYEFVKDYVREFGQTPDFRTVVAEHADFDYHADVHDAYPYLCKTLKGATAKRKAVTILGEKANENFKTMNGTDFANWMFEQATLLKATAESSSSSGTNYATNGAERKEWYLDSKEQRSYTYIPTPYPSLTQWLGGGFELGDGTLIMAYSNKGKSWLGSHTAIIGHESNFGVLYYSPELTKKQQLFRFDTLKGHFNNVNIRRGLLEDEANYFQFLDGFNDSNEVPFIVKTMEDLPKGLSTDVIEADLQANENIKLVVIDGFNLMDHGRGGRDGMTKTSRTLRQIWGKYGVHGITIHQTPTSAEKENSSDEIDGVLEVPQLTDYSETIAVIQDNANVLTFNQRDGIGKCLLAKCREPKVGAILDLRCNFNYGWITEATPIDFM
jgi:replicative DNA helicase